MNAGRDASVIVPLAWKVDAFQDLGGAQKEVLCYGAIVLLTHLRCILVIRFLPKSVRITSLLLLTRSPSTPDRGKLFSDLGDERTKEC